MYKLLLVDDEEEVRKGILQKLDWHSLGFEIPLEAENGKEALEISEKFFPDIILTDIKMPFMDGLQLSKEIKQKFPTVKIIIITGFDDFEYAKAAIGLNVIEYILKPVSSDEIIKLLKKVKSQLDEEILQKSNIEFLLDSYNKNLPILIERFFYQLIQGFYSYEEIIEKGNSLKLKIDGSQYIISVLSINKSNSNDQLTDEKNLYLFASLNIVNEIVENSHVFVLENNLIIINIHSFNSKEAAINSTLLKMEEIRQAIKKFLNLSVTIGVGNIVDNIVNTKFSYSSALSALDYRLVVGNDRVIFIKDIEPNNDNSLIFDELIERSLISTLKTGDTNNLSNILNDILDESKLCSASLKDIQIYILEILTTIIKTAKSSNIDISQFLNSNCNIFIELYNFQEIPQLKVWLKNICIKIIDLISKNRLDSCNEIVEKAKHFIYMYYSETDITIDKVCKFLHISPAYFSTIFKKDTKYTFITFLTNYRLNKAKELLETTTLKFFEIANKVGYQDANYFSYSFKKNFGISPSKYRSSKRSE